MLGVIFWEVLGLFVLGITLYLLAVAKPGTVIDNDGRQVVVMSAKTTRRKDTYVLIPKWKLLLSGLATALLFLIMGVFVYTKRFL